MSKADYLENSGESLQTSSLRLWPGVIIVALQWLIRFVIPVVVPNGMVIGVIGAMLGTIAVAVWWIFFSRAPRIERFGAIILVILSLYGTSFLLDKSILKANIGLMFIIYSTPVMCLALVIWAVAARNLPTSFRRATMIITILLASGMWTLLRTNGMTGEGHHNLAWRWAKTDEDRLLEQTGNETNGNDASDKPVEVINACWPGFRGANRDGVSVTHKGEEWTTTDVWTSPGLKSVFNDQVIHKGFAYGFDGPFMVCVDLQDGRRKWRGGRYQGFTLLLADQDIILVLTEKGEIVLVSASPDKFTELSRFRAINGKTWNHPVLAGNIILVRNDREMAAFRAEEQGSSVLRSTK